MKKRWSWKHYSFQPHIEYGKVKGWPVWVVVAIACTGIIGTSFALAHTGRNPSAENGSHTIQDANGKGRNAEHRLYDQSDCKKILNNKYDCTRWQDINLEKYAVEMLVTAYSSTEDQTDSTPFITANGTPVHEGIIANNCLPFGTKVWIDGRIYEVHDRMNARYGCGIFDIWMSSRPQAIAWGRKVELVTIVP